MTWEETFRQLMGLGEAWRVAKARFEVRFSTFLLKVEEALEIFSEQSVRAGTPVFYQDHFEPMRWLHLKVFEKVCMFICALPRGRLSNYGKVYRVTPPWEGRSYHFTK